MICTSIGNCSVDECISAINGSPFSEVRLDSIKSIDAHGVKKIFSQKAKLIATCRPDSKSESAQKELLFAAIDAGAAYVDIEVDAEDAYKNEVVKKAKSKGCKIIMSYHDFEKTPVRQELDQIIIWCFDSNADIAKIACQVNSDQDASRLLGLLDDKRKIVVVGMGQKGKIVRIAAPLLGSPFTYASLSGGKETASGQIPRKEMERILRVLSSV